MQDKSHFNLVTTNSRHNSGKLSLQCSVLKRVDSPFLLCSGCVVSICPQGGRTNFILELKSNMTSSFYKIRGERSTYVH